MIIATRTNMSETREETDFLKRKMLSDHLGEIEGKPFKFTKKMNDCGYGIDIILETISDVVEVRHGEWVFGKLGGRDAWVCTLCGAGFTGENAEWIAKEHDFCLKCGAKMDGEKADITNKKD